VIPNTKSTNRNFKNEKELKIHIEQPNEIYRLDAKSKKNYRNTQSANQNKNCPKKTKRNKKNSDQTNRRRNVPI
jgi:hypothetical protein